MMRRDFVKLCLIVPVARVLKVPPPKDGGPKILTHEHLPCIRQRSWLISHDGDRQAVTTVLPTNGQGTFRLASTYKVKEPCDLMTQYVSLAGQCIRESLLGDWRLMEGDTMNTTWSLFATDLNGRRLSALDLNHLTDEELVALLLRSTWNA